MLTARFRVSFGGDLFAQPSKVLKNNPNNTRLHEGQKSRVHLRVECVEGWKYSECYLRYDVWVVLVGV